MTQVPARGPNPGGAGRRPGPIDEAAVERVAAGHGDAARLTVAEREEVVRRLHAHRISDLAIARRTGISSRTVLRIRQRLRLRPVT